MIEKFTPEELKQICADLGIKYDSRRIKLNSIEIDEKNRICELTKEKPFKFSTQNLNGKVYESCVTLISFALNNVVKTRNGYVKALDTIDRKDIDEYKEMFGEIISIIEKHNRHAV